MDERAVASFRDSLREMGEERARDILRRGHFNTRRTKLAEEWLAEQENSREARLSRKALQTAHRTEIAAWIAAAAAVATILLMVFGGR